MFLRLLTATLAIVHANVVDVDQGRIQSDVTVLIEDGRITEISSTVDVPRDAEIIDLEQKYLLPGLIDAHNHVSGSREARRALDSGVTTIRVMGAHHFADVGLRELRRIGAVTAPEIFAAGYHVGPGPSHGPNDEPPEALFLDAPDLADLKGGIHGPESYRRVTALQLARDVDWIKTTATARAGSPNTDPREQIMTQEELAAVVETARQAGVEVGAHAHGDEGALAAVNAGVRSIEHGTYLSDGTLHAMREKGAYLIPTIAVVRDLSEPGGNYDHPFLQVRGRHMLPRIQDVVRRAHRLGVKIATGTDTDFGPENTIRVQHEIEELTRSGLSPAEAIRAATLVAARLLGISDRTGVVLAGLEADFIAVERNPLDDIAAIHDVLLVMSDGDVIVDRLRFALE